MLFQIGTVGFKFGGWHSNLVGGTEYCTEYWPAPNIGQHWFYFAEMIPIKLSKL